MTSYRTAAVLCCAAYLVGTCIPSLQDSDANRKPDAKKAEWVYELRTYTTAPGKLDDLNRRFKNHTMRLFERHGIKNVAYWTLAEDSKHEDKGTTLIYVIAHKNRAVAKESWKAFMGDEDWKKAWAESKKEGPVVTKVKSIFLKQTDYSPNPLKALMKMKSANAMKGESHGEHKEHKERGEK